MILLDETKKEESERLARDVQRFVKTGGKIQKIEGYVYRDDHLIGLMTKEKAQALRKASKRGSPKK